MQNHPNKQNITFSYNPVKYTRSHQVQCATEVPVCGRKSCNFGILYILSQDIIIKPHHVEKHPCIENPSTQSNSLQNRIFWKMYPLGREKNCEKLRRYMIWIYGSHAVHNILNCIKRTITHHCVSISFMPATSLQKFTRTGNSTEIYSREVCLENFDSANVLWLVLGLFLQKTPGGNSLVVRCRGSLVSRSLSEYF